MGGQTGADEVSLERSDLIEAIAQLRVAIDAGDEVGPLVELLSELALDYADITPNVMVSRCPFTAVPVHYPMDVTGLDGPYWDADAPIRHLPERAATLLAVTGAVATSGEIEPGAFERELGPPHHVLHPSILELPGVKAVLSSVAVGPHSALVTAYFQNPVLVALRDVPELGTHRLLSWGTDRLAPRAVGSERVVLDDAPAGWFDDERICWIAPADDEWVLRTGRDGCPYTEGPYVEGSKR